MKKIVAIYARTSSDKQVDNHSIYQQLADCKTLAERENLKNIKEYVDEGYSAKSQNRPALQQLINDVKKKLISHLLIDDWDRFTRL